MAKINSAALLYFDIVENETVMANKKFQPDANQCWGCIYDVSRTIDFGTLQDRRGIRRPSLLFIIIHAPVRQCQRAIE